ncbi:MAG: hypothetical protein IPL90_12685 [Holophagales bacterium]|nr:hypothetical protein [Holophagales bacterium]
MSEKTRIPKTASTALLVALGALVPYLVSGMERLRLVGETDLSLATGSFRGVLARPREAERVVRSRPG